MTITYKNKELYQGEDFASESRHHVRLYLPSEAPLNTIFIGLVVILVVLLMFMVLLFLRKQRQKTRKILNESQELLATKKALLLSVLKDVEKQHRNKDISDDTYSKLKEEYKQDAVEVMKKLDDIEKQ
jgi:CHASE3 domain sensor protein